MGLTINSITLSKVVSCETYERQETIRKSKTARQAQEMEWEAGGGAGRQGGGEIKAGRLGRKGKGSLSLFPLTLFPATPPPPPLPCLHSPVTRLRNCVLV